MSPRSVSEDSFTSSIALIYAESREPTSGLEPLTCSLRVITQALQRYAGGCKFCISRGVSFPCLAACCTVLRSQWYQSGIRTSDSYTLTVGPIACRRALRHHSSGRGGQVEADGLFGVCIP